MPSINAFLNRDVPGTYVSESTFGIIPAGLASHSAVYMLGHSTRPTAPKNTPTFISSPDDFYNVFGVSASTNSVALFFAQRSGVGLYFVNVPIKQERTFTIPTVTAGATYIVTIDSYDISYTAQDGDDVNHIMEQLATKVNSLSSHVCTARYTGVTPGTLRFKPGVPVLASANITLGLPNTAPSYPVLADVVDSINTAFEPELRQGFLIAPEFFQSFTSVTDRQALANSMEALCADPGYYWVALADCGSTIATASNGAGLVSLAITERNGLQSPRGHLGYYMPYWKDTKGNLVPMSASVAGVALRRYRDEGFREPPAGTAFPVYGIADISANITDKIQGQLNPLGINCGRFLPAGRGRVIYAARTVSTNPYYRFMTTRVIMNVLAGSLRTAFDSIIFSTVDGLGALFGRIKQTAVAICERMRVAGALFGATPDEAYLCICDLSNNPAIDLEAGMVNLDVLAKPAPLMEVLNVRLARTSIGTVLAEVAASGDPTAPDNPKLEPSDPRSSTGTTGITT